jgi:hypothetical protein
MGFARPPEEAYRLFAWWDSGPFPSFPGISGVFRGKRLHILFLSASNGRFFDTFFDV